jgi:hypothetical protein
MRMARVNVYLPDELAQQAKAYMCLWAVGEFVDI